MELTQLEKLDRIERMTHPDGTVDVELVKFTHLDSRCFITIVTPNGDEVELRYKFPERATEDYSIVKIANLYCGGLPGLDDLDELPVTARATVEDGKWQIVTPPSIVDRVWQIVTSLSIVDRVRPSTDTIFVISFVGWIISVIGWILYGFLTLAGSVGPVSEAYYMVWFVMMIIMFVIPARLSEE